MKDNFFDLSKQKIVMVPYEAKMQEPKSRELKFDSTPKDRDFSVFLKIKDWIVRFDYKPNFAFNFEYRARFSEHPELILLIRVRTMDSKNLLSQTTINHLSSLSVKAIYNWEFEDFSRWLFDQIRHVEEHEMGEFFSCDGKLPFDPHVGDTKF